MFDAVLESHGPRRPIGRGALVSLAVHGVLIAGAVYLSAHGGDNKQKVDRVVTFFNPPAPPPPPPPPPPAGGASHPHKTEPKKVIKKPDTVVQTDKKIETPPEPDKKQPEPEPGGQAGGVVGGVQGGVVGGVVGGTVGGVLGNELKPSNSVLPFGPGMNRPTLLSHSDPVYTREAAAMSIEGLALAKCVVTTTGALRNCHLIKGLQFMDASILAALATWKYTPITFQGQVVSVEMTIPVHVKAH